MGLLDGLFNGVAKKIAREHAKSVAQDLGSSAAHFREANASQSLSGMECVRMALAAREGWQFIGNDEFVHMKSFVQFEFSDELGLTESVGRVALVELRQIWQEAGYSEGMQAVLMREALGGLGEVFARWAAGRS